MKKNNLLNYFTSEELLIISRDMDFVNQARVIVTRLFENKFDQAGEPYIGHLIRVSERLSDPIEKAAALLHDTVEDTEVTLHDLFLIGIPLNVLEVIGLVTQDKISKSNMTKSEQLEMYNNYIDKIINSGNIHAIRLKKADILDNYDLERIKKLPEDKQEWFHEKYEEQLIKLGKIKGAMDI